MRKLPFNGGDRARKPTKLPDYFTDDEAKALLAAAPSYIVALTMAFRLGMGLLGIYSLLRSEGEEVVITFMAVLSLGFLGLGMVAVALVAVRLWSERRDR